MPRFAAPALALFLVAGCSAPTPDPRGVERDEVLVQVSASGRAEAKPDEARFTAGVETIAATSAEASARNAATMNAVAAALGRLGVKREDLQTQALRLARIDYGPNRGRFQAQNLVEVRVRDVAKAGEAVAAVTQAGANVVSGPNLAVSDPENASRTAYAAAYRAARARAEAYAGAAGMRVARVLAIRDGGGERPPRPYYGDAAETAGVVAQAAAPPVEAGRTRSEVQVRVDFALAPK
ncbi:MAG TPA: SIMPL domain-containing protein [Allosphingosinicella sp.]|nr:SIMPL domain-containing protein [Allosphingosinicella sp.]